MGPPDDNNNISKDVKPPKQHDTGTKGRGGGMIDMQSRRRRRRHRDTDIHSSENSNNAAKNKYNNSQSQNNYNSKQTNNNKADMYVDVWGDSNPSYHSNNDSNNSINNHINNKYNNNTKNNNTKNNYNNQNAASNNINRGIRSRGSGRDPGGGGLHRRRHGGWKDGHHGGRRRGSHTNSNNDERNNQRGGGGGGASYNDLQSNNYNNANTSSNNQNNSKQQMINNKVSNKPNAEKNNKHENKYKSYNRNQNAKSHFNNNNDNTYQHQQQIPLGTYHPQANPSLVTSSNDVYTTCQNDNHLDEFKMVQPMLTNNNTTSTQQNKNNTYNIQNQSTSQKGTTQHINKNYDRHGSSNNPANKNKTNTDDHKSNLTMQLGSGRVIYVTDLDSDANKLNLLCQTLSFAQFKAVIVRCDTNDQYIYHSRKWDGILNFPIPWDQTEEKTQLIWHMLPMLVQEGFWVIVPGNENNNNIRHNVIVIADTADYIQRKLNEVIKMTHCDEHQMNINQLQNQLRSLLPEQLVKAEMTGPDPHPTDMPDDEWILNRRFYEPEVPKYADDSIEHVLNRALYHQKERIIDYRYWATMPIQTIVPYENWKHYYKKLDVPMPALQQVYFLLQKMPQKYPEIRSDPQQITQLLDLLDFESYFEKKYNDSLQLFTNNSKTRWYHAQRFISAVREIVRHQSIAKDMILVCAHIPL